MEKLQKPNTARGAEIVVPLETRQSPFSNRSKRESGTSLRPVCVVLVHKVHILWYLMNTYVYNQRFSIEFSKINSFHYKKSLVRKYKKIQDHGKLKK